MLHVLKIVVELVVTVLAMCLMSWGLAWLLRRMRIKPRLAAMLANPLCFVSFVAWLYFDLKPYGGLEISMIVFGVIVWGGCLAFDLWRIGRKANSSAISA